MTYEGYKEYGGTCPEALFLANQTAAEVVLKKLESEFAVKYPCAEARDIVLARLIDLSFEDAQSQGGTLLSVKAGSYSEQRRAIDQAERRAKPFNILKTYADVRMRRVGVII